MNSITHRANEFEQTLSFAKAKLIPTILIFFYFSLPKINIIPVGSYGLRIQDLISIFMILGIPWGKTKPSINQKYFIFSSIYLLYLLSVGTYIDLTSSTLDFFRLIQYILIGLYIYYKISIKCLTAIIFFQFSLAALQFLGKIPNFDTGRGLIYSNQYSGTFGVASEFTYAMILLLSIRYKHKFHMSTGSLFAMMNGTIASILIFTSNITINSHISRSIILWSSLLGSIALPAYVMKINIYDFFGFNTINIVAIKDFALFGYVHGEMLSLIHRSSKAIGLLEVMLGNPLFLVGGFGFGAVFTPLDFGLLRIFANYGIVGLIIFFHFIKPLPFRFFLAILIANLMFDGLWSSTISPLIFYIYFKTKQIRKAN